MSCGDIFLGLIAVLFPPVAVWIKSGLCSADSFINILLCCLGYLPGLIHAWYIIAKYPEYDYEVIPDSEGGAAGRGGQRVTYYYVSQENTRPQRSAGYGTQSQNQNQSSGRKPQGRAPAIPPQNGRPAGNAGVGPSSGASARDDGAAPPPSYDDAVRGDHKVQSRE